MMSTNPFMPPVLPQTPAPELNSAAGKNPAAFKSNRMGEGSDQGQSFSETLNQVSDRNRRCNPDSTAAERPAVKTRGADAEAEKRGKMAKPKRVTPDHIEENGGQGAPVSGNESRPVFLWPVFGLMPSHIMNGSGADDGSLAPETPSDSNPGLKRMLVDWIAHLQSQGQKAQGDWVGIGPFEQLQADISPEALNRLWVKQLADLAIHPEGSGDLMAKPVHDGAFAGRPEASGADVNALLQLLKLHGAAAGLNPDTGGLGEPKMAAGLEGAHLNEDLLLKMTSPDQSAAANRFENAKMALAGHEGRLALGSLDNLNSDTPLDAQGRPLNGDTQALKNQTVFRAAPQQPADPNAAAQAATAKTPEEIFGVKNPVSKSEIQPIQTLGNKISQVDGESKDSSFLFSQDQMPQHLDRLENTAQRSEAAQRGLMAQTLNQIVQKAVHLFHNGQHEVQIDLKPDFLGHIRMQIVTESQQVAVRIVAELPFVKEMLENNLNHLKAELQAQGLKVDALEVSVAHDSGADDDKQQKAAELNRARALKSGRLSFDAGAEEQTEAPAGRFDKISETAIDFFA